MASRNTTNKDGEGILGGSSKISVENSKDHRLKAVSEPTSTDDDDHHHHSTKSRSPCVSSDCERRITALEDRSREIRDEVVASLSPRGREEHNKREARKRRDDDRRCIGCAEGCAECCGGCECVIL